MSLSQDSSVSDSDPPGRESRSGSKSLSQRIRIVAASNLAIMVIGLGFLLQYWRLEAMVVFWALVAALAIVAINVVFLLKTRNIRVAGYVSASVLFAVLVVSISVSGGFYDPAFSWLYAVPLAAAFLVDLTALVVFTALVLAATVAFWLLPAAATPNVIPTEMYPLHSLFNRLATVLSLGVMTGFFVRAQYLAHRLLKKSNQALEEEVDAHDRTEEALRSSEAQYRDLVENSADLIFTHDLEGTVVTANEAFGRFLGFPPEVIIGGGLRRFLAPNSEGDWDTYLETIREAGAYRGLLTLVDKSGAPRELEFHNTLRTDASGPALVRGLARDVTKQVAAHRALRGRVDQEQLMVAISSRFIDIGSEHVAEGITSALSEVGGFLDCRRLRFLLLEDDQRTFSELSRWSTEPEGEARPEARLPTLLARLHQFETIVVPDLASLELTERSELVALLGPDIRSAVIVPVFGRHGLLGLLTLESDESHRAWLREHQALAHIAGSVFGNAIMRARDEERTLRLQEEVQQARKMESLGLIAGGIAHDFNNLLMVVLGNTSLALSQVDQGSGVDEALHAIDSSARRAAKLTAQMLAYAGGVTPSRGSVDLGQLVASEIAELKVKLPAHLVLETIEPDDSVLVHADAGLLRQILRALLENSVEAIGEAPGSVEVSTQSVAIHGSTQARGYRPIQGAPAPGVYGVLEVRDSGSGIEASEMQKIFDPFFSTKFAGRGLGLAAVLGTVRGHAGFIEAESEPGATRVRICIPQAKEVEEAATQGAAADRERVLVFDPSRSFAPDLAGAAHGHKLGLERVDTAADMLERLSEDGAHLSAVVAELAGVEESDALCAERWRLEHLPWVFCGDLPREQVAGRLAAVGASGYFSTPVGGPELLSLVEVLLREYRLAAEGGAKSRRAATRQKDG